MPTSPAGSPARDVPQILAHASRTTTAAMRQHTARLPPHTRHLAGIHFGWWDEHGTPLSGNHGKALRPALALLCCQAAGGRSTDALDAAAAVELVHGATLLHDDLIDQDEQRRGRPTLWTTHGTAAAVLTGAALYLLAVDILLDAPAPLSAQGPQELIRSLSTAIDSCHTELDLTAATTAPLQQAEAVAAAKTGELIALACLLGALCARADEERAEHYRAYGHHLGAAFQITDDLLGIWGDPQRTGKPASSDLRHRRVTLPVAAALSDGRPAAQELAALYHQPLHEDDLPTAAALVEAAGGRTWAEQRARHHTEQALARLRDANAAPHPAAELAALLHFAAHRDH